VAEIYIEDIATQEAEQGKGVVPVVIESRPTIGDQIKAKKFAAGGNETQHEDEPEKQVECNDSSSDNDFIPGDDSSSEEDEEAKEILRKFKQFKKNLRSGQVAHLDDIVLESSTAMLPGYSVVEDGNETPYLDTDDEESIEEVGTDGELKRKPSDYPRFKKSKNVPKFCLGMKFSSKADFKKAIIKYGLAERKVINFIKDEPMRVRAKCDWPHCPWVCLLSDNSRTEGWQIVTFEDFHTCPPRRDNMLVTARRIAEKYEKFILANPSWNIVSMMQTVQEEMFAVN
jgi:hypothetical protein